MVMKTVEFKDVKLDENFWDPDSGEYLAKVTETDGVFLTGGDYFIGELCPFQPNEIVEQEFGV